MRLSLRETALALFASLILVSAPAFAEGVDSETVDGALVPDPAITVQEDVEGTNDELVPVTLSSPAPAPATDPEPDTTPEPTPEAGAVIGEDAI